MDFQIMARVNQMKMHQFGFSDKNPDEQGQKFASGGNSIFGEGKVLK